MSNKVFTLEKVRDLVEKLGGWKLDAEIESIITEWLEQNQPEPIVVGLSDEQVNKLAGYIYNEAGRGTKHQIVTFLKTQSFTQPKVKEISVGLDDELVDGLASEFTKIFGYMDEELTKVDTFAHIIHYWQKSQTFTQPQQLTPNWDDGPNWANWLAQDNNGAWTWFEYKPFNRIRDWIYEEGKHTDGRYAPVIESGCWQQTLQERPKPTPVVKAGQVWEHKRKGSNYGVLGFLKTYVNGEWIEYVRYTEGSAEYGKPLDDFLAKFERVI